MPIESLAARKERTARITAFLAQAYRDCRIALNFSNPLELLVATILSAQCTDQRVNQVTESLFKKYRTALDYAEADPVEFEQDIRPTGFYRNKTKSVMGAAARIVSAYAGQVPDAMEDLLTLPGVARKTANVVLSQSFGKAEGIIVDTHVIRVSQRLGLTKYKNNSGDHIEKDLLELVERKNWGDFGNQMIWHGRKVCTARHPKCTECALSELCPSAFKLP
jgi:endonuclease-3